MRTDRELRDEIRRLRDRGKMLSGFWVAELAAAAYSLEWALGKHEKPPSEDIGSSGSAQGRIASSLVKAAEKEAASAKKKAAAVKAPAAPEKPETKVKPKTSLRRVK